MNYIVTITRKLTEKIMTNRVLRFLASGGTAAASEYAMFSFLLVLDAPLLIANTLSFMTGLTISYNLNRLWVFESSGGRVRFATYAALATANLFVSNLAIFAIVDVGVSAFIAKILVMGLIAINNYFLYAKFIFKD